MDAGRAARDAKVPAFLSTLHLTFPTWQSKVKSISPCRFNFHRSEKWIFTARFLQKPHRKTASSLCLSLFLFSVSVACCLRLLTRVSNPCSSSIASRNLWETRLSCSPSSERSVELFRSRFGALSRVFWWVPRAKSRRWVCLCVFLDLRFLLQKNLLDFLRRFIYVFLFCGEELWSGFFLGVYAYGTKEFSTDVCSVFLCSGDKVLSALLLLLSLFVARDILCRAHSLPCVLVSLISLRGSV